MGAVATKSQCESQTADLRGNTGNHIWHTDFEMACKVRVIACTVLQAMVRANAAPFRPVCPNTLVRACEEMHFGAMHSPSRALPRFCQRCVRQCTRIVIDITVLVATIGTTHLTTV